MRQALAFVVLALALSACGTSVQRMDAGEVKDVSGKWNDTDSRLVSDEMIQEAMTLNGQSRPWLSNFMKDRGKSPAVIVGDPAWADAVRRDVARRVVA
ncbi:MAG: hypothetical protein ABL955_09230 [Elusimicrobiota bacterium]